MTRASDGESARAGVTGKPLRDPPSRPRKAGRGARPAEVAFQRGDEVQLTGPAPVATGSIFRLRAGDRGTVELVGSRVVVVRIDSVLVPVPKDCLTAADGHHEDSDPDFRFLG